MSAAAMEVDVVAGSGLRDLETVLASVADRLEKVAESTGRIKGNVRGIKGAPSGSATGGGGGGSSRGRGSASSAADRFYGGPNQTLLEIQAQRKRAEALTDSIRREAILADLAQREFRAKRSNILNQRRMEQGDTALNRPGLLELFGDLNSLLGHVFSGNAAGAARDIGKGIKLWDQATQGGLNVEQKVARSAVGGRLPVAQVVQTAGQAAGAAGEAGGAEAAGALGGSAAAIGFLGPAAIVVGSLLLAAKAAQVFAEETTASAARMHSNAAVAAVSGGYGDAARLRALGFSPSEIGSSSGLRDRLASDGLAQLTAAQYGIGPVLPSAYSRDQNDARLELSVVRAIREAFKEGGIDEAKRVARIFGRENDLDKALVSDRVFSLAGRVGANGEFIDKRYGQYGRDYDRQMDLLGEQGNHLKDLTLGPAIHELEMGVGGVNTILERLIGAGGKLSDVWDKTVEGLMRFNPIFGPELSALQALNGTNDHQTTQDALIKSNYDLMGSLDRLSAQFHRPYGNGPYGDSFQPSATRNNPKAWKDFMENSGYFEPLG